MSYLGYRDGRTRTSCGANMGIESEEGVFLAFLDADDVWHPQKLEQQLRVLE